MAHSPFNPALIVVDFQEDFCPPNGSLAVPDGRSIAPVVNALLRLPFILKIATKDWHPANHVSFAQNHDDAEPFVSTTTITNPLDPSESQTTRLWPVHCVQDTHGAQLVPELDEGLIDRVIEKGQDARVEMYSAFQDPFEKARVVDSRLADALRAEDVTHVFVVGLAGDYCVKHTAIDAAANGFSTYVVDEGVRSVFAEGWGGVKGEMEDKGVSVVAVRGEEVARVGGSLALE